MANTKFSITKTSMELKVENFEDLPLDRHYFYCSPSVRFSDTSLLLRIYPVCRPCNLDNKIDWIGLYLLEDRPRTFPCIFFRLGIKNADGSIFEASDGKLEYNNDDDRNEGTFFIKRSAVLCSKGAVADDGSMIVFCIISIENVLAKDAALQTSASNDTHTLSRDLKDLYLNGHHADITITVKGKEFTAHKCILASRSKVFAAMFHDGFEEENSGAVKVDDSDEKFFEQFLLHLYTGSLDVVNSDNSISLYMTADKYDVSELKEECARSMVQNLSVDSFCDVVRLATMHDEDDLLTSATTFFINNLKPILHTTKWQGFLAENPTLGNELFIKTLEKPEKK